MSRAELIRPVAELLRDHAEVNGNKLAYSDGRTALSYGRLAARTARLAGHLADLGPARGERVAIWLDNRVEAVESYLAAVRAAGVGVPVNPRSTDKVRRFAGGPEAVRV
ncbi:AMP-binding protein [Streptomyces sp. NPDC059922]|uniref:AMP-binding protein n=1 Tax=Streptomyces sp. NPDC059922 TaxID=3347005 RepID=UPI00364A116D